MADPTKAEIMLDQVTKINALIRRFQPTRRGNRLNKTKHIRVTCCGRYHVGLKVDFQGENRVAFVLLIPPKTGRFPQTLKY